jgi:hypothetical protein
MCASSSGGAAACFSARGAALSMSNQPGLWTIGQKCIISTFKTLSTYLVFRTYSLILLFVLSHLYHTAVYILVIWRAAEAGYLNRSCRPLLDNGSITRFPVSLCG